MQENNKIILEKANAAISKGDYEGFLSYCTEDTKWEFVGEKTLIGKNAVREYLAITYREPPGFSVENLVAEGEFVTAIGTIRMKNSDGRTVDYSYCDVWRIRDNKLAELKSFVIENKSV